MTAQEQKEYDEEQEAWRALSGRLMSPAEAKKSAEANSSLPDFVPTENRTDIEGFNFADAAEAPPEQEIKTQKPPIPKAIPKAQTPNPKGQKAQPQKPPEFKDAPPEVVLGQMIAQGKMSPLALQLLQRQQEIEEQTTGTSELTTKEVKEAAATEAPTAASAALETKAGIDELKAEKAVRGVKAEDFVNRMTKDLAPAANREERVKQVAQRILKEETKVFGNAPVSDKDRIERTETLARQVVEAEEAKASGKEMKTETRTALTKQSKDYFKREYYREGKVQKDKAPEGPLEKEKNEPSTAVSGFGGSESAFDALDKLGGILPRLPTKNKGSKTGNAVMDRVERYTEQGMSQEEAEKKAIDEVAKKTGKKADAVKSEYEKTKAEIMKEGEVIKDSNIEATMALNKLSDLTQRIVVLEEFMHGVDYR